MAFSTLSNFGVPLSANTGRNSILQPKVRYKFRVRVFNFGPIGGGLEFTQQVATASRPTRTFSDQAVHSYNSTAYYAGKSEFNTINIALRDDVTNTAAKLVGYQHQKQMNAFEQTSPLAGSDYKFDTYLEMLTGGNDTAALEQWYLEGCFLTSVDYGDMDYSSSDPMMINLTVRFDNATQSGGLFEANPQTLGGVTI